MGWLTFTFRQVFHAEIHASITSCVNLLIWFHFCFSLQKKFEALFGEKLEVVRTPQVGVVHLTCLFKRKHSKQKKTNLYFAVFCHTWLLQQAIIRTMVYTQNCFIFLQYKRTQEIHVRERWIPTQWCLFLSSKEKHHDSWRTSKVASLYTR